MEPSKYHLLGNEYDFNKVHGPNFETNSSRSDYKLKPTQWTPMDQEALEMAALLAVKHKTDSTKAAYDKLLQRKLELMQGTGGGKSRRTRRKCRNALKKSRHARRKSRHAKK